MTATSAVSTATDPTTPTSPTTLESPTSSAETNAAVPTPSGTSSTSESPSEDAETNGPGTSPHRAPAAPKTLSSLSRGIDQTAFPMIMDMIIDSAPHGSLAVIGSTCTKYRERVRKMAPRHIAISDQRPCILGPSGPEPTLSASSLEGYYPRVVDYHLDCGNSALTSKPSLLFKVSIIRLWFQDGGIDPQDWAGDPNTFVLFCWPRAEDKNIRYRPVDDMDLRAWVMSRLPLRLHPSQPWPPLHQSAPPKLVINIDIRPWWEKLMITRQLDDYWDALTEIVVIFQQRNTPLPMDYGYDDKDFRLVLHSAGIMELLHTINNECYKRKDRPKPLRATIVNSDCLPETIFTITQDGYSIDTSKFPPGSQTCSIARAYLESEFKGYENWPGFEYLSMDEYEKRVGTIQFKLETDDTYMMQ